MTLTLIDLSRQRAGERAMQIVQRRGPEDGADLLQGFGLGFLISWAALKGWPHVLETIREVSAKHYVPPRGEKLRVVRENGE